MFQKTAAATFLLFIGLLIATPNANADFKEPEAPKVLILLAEGFNTGEFWQPYYALLAAGYSVDIAAPEAGVIQAGKKPSDRDAKADLTLDQVKPADYFAIVIPGGYSPANLEKHEKALEISRHFMKENKPVAAVCHGPRLLAKAGTLNGRITTGLWTLKDELPELWHDGAFGTYLDKAVVIDGNLTTSRFPNDVVQFSRAMLVEFAKAGGLKTNDQGFAHVLFIDPAGSRRVGWSLGYGGIQGQGIRVTPLRTWAIERYLATPDALKNVDAIIVGTGRDDAQYPKHKAFTQLMQAAKKANIAVHALGENSETVKTAGGPTPVAYAAELDALPQTLIAIVKSLHTKNNGIVSKDTTAKSAEDVVIALHPGFDAQVVFAMKAAVQAKGHTVTLVGSDSDWMKAMSGHPIKTDKSYSDELIIGKGTLIIAPGGLWPENETTHPARVKWLVSAYESGASVMAFGFDSLWLGRLEQFAGKKFATSQQAVWSFGKKKGKYSNNLIEQTTDRLLTARGPEALPEIIRIMLTPPKATAAAGE